MNNKLFVGTVMVVIISFGLIPFILLSSCLLDKKIVTSIWYWLLLWIISVCASYVTSSYLRFKPFVKWIWVTMMAILVVLCALIEVR